MPTPINAELFVSAFNPTGTPGEYSLDAAVFSNQADVTGNGAYDVSVGFLLYVPASSLATALPIPGVMHRYKFTAVAAADSQTLSGTIIWDEEGDEEDSPTSGVACLLAEATPNNKLGLLPADVLYPEMTPGSTVGAIRTDTKRVLDKLGTGGTGGPTPAVLTFAFSESLRWEVQHNRGTRVFVESLKDANGHRFYADVEVVDDNLFYVHLAEALAGSVDVTFPASA